MDGLKRVPVHLAGDWRPVQNVGHLDWAGTARADEPITALVLCRESGGTSWARVGRAVHSNELTVTLRVRPGAGPHRLDVAIWLTVDPGGGPALGRHATLRPEMRLTSTAPFMISVAEIVTGEVAWFVRT